MSLSPPLPSSAPAGSELRSQMTAVARRSYFTSSLAVKKDGVITVVEWQLGSEAGGEDALRGVSLRLKVAGRRADRE